MEAHNRLYIIGGYEGKPKFEINYLIVARGLTFKFFKLFKWKLEIVISNLEIGQYLDDVWEFDFTTMMYSKISIEGDDKEFVSRSNHTSIYYEKTDS